MTAERHPQPPMRFPGTGRPPERRYYPVLWRDDDGNERNTWSRNALTNELSPDPDGDPMYTTTTPIAAPKAPPPGGRRRRRQG